MQSKALLIFIYNAIQYSLFDTAALMYLITSTSAVVVDEDAHKKYFYLA